MLSHRWVLPVVFSLLGTKYVTTADDNDHHHLQGKERLHRRQAFFDGPPFGPPLLPPPMNVPRVMFPPPQIGPPHPIVPNPFPLVEPPPVPPPQPIIVPPVEPLPVETMIPSGAPIPPVEIEPQIEWPRQTATSRAKYPSRKYPPHRQRPRKRFRTRPQPKQGITTTKKAFLEHPEVKNFIAEINRYTTAYNKPNEGYDRVLEIMQDYFTRRSPTNTEYDGTLIKPTIFGANDELVANREITGNLFENDMALTVAQMLQATSPQQSRFRRKVIADPKLRWKGAVVPYYFSDPDKAWQRRIKNTLNYYENETCVRFVERSDATDFIYFLKGKGCFSAVGKLGGSQPLSVGLGCESLGVISHEIGHALGFVHEQERPERDSYVRINLQYAIPGTEGNFDKRPLGTTVDLGVPYDLGSVMHYASTAFTFESLRHTVDPIDTKYRSTVGNRVAPSFTDIKQINRAYCADSCRNTINICENEGYPDPNDCSRCKCPQGLGGATCTDLEYSSCGGEIQADYEWQSLNYSVSSTCYWRISAYPGGHVRFKVTDVFFKCSPTCSEFIEIKYLADMQVTGFRLCCYPEGGVLVSHGPFILLIVRAVAPSRFAIKYLSDGGIKPSDAQDVWSEWGEWSECSEMCGACGFKRRHRNCLEGTCKYRIQPQSQRCNMNACMPGATLSRYRNGRKIRRRLRRMSSTHEWCCERFIARNGRCYPVG